MAKLTEKEISLLNDSEFRSIYINYLVDKLHSLSSLSPNIKQNDIRYENKDAYKRLFSKLGHNLTAEEIILLADDINSNSMFITNGYREVGDCLDGEEDKPICLPSEISSKMNESLNKYNNSSEDYYLREARLNKEVYMIHPFMDGNTRTTRALLVFNMLNNGYVPAFQTVNSYTTPLDELTMRIEDSSDKESVILDEMITKYEESKTTGYSK